MLRAPGPEWSHCKLVLLSLPLAVPVSVSCSRVALHVLRAGPQLLYALHVAHPRPKTSKDTFGEEEPCQIPEYCGRDDRVAHQIPSARHMISVAGSEVKVGVQVLQEHSIL